jgi:hypothetical protein
MIFSQNDQCSLIKLTIKVKAWQSIQKKLMNKYEVLKEIVLHENTRKQIQILLEFHFETIEPLIGFIINQLEFF